MKRTTLAMLASMTALSLTMVNVSTAAATTATTQWVGTATQAIQLNSATLLGALPASTPLTIHVALALHNKSALDNYIKSINTPGDPLYGQSLTPEQFTATYGPTSSDVNAVTNYLTSNGFTNITVEPNRLFVTATGTAAQVQTAFNTTLNQYLQNGKTVFANSTPVQVPDSLGGIVASVLGVNNASVMTTPTHPASVGGLNVPASYDPQGYWKAYNVGNTSTGGATGIAMFAEGDLTQVVNDLRTEEQASNLPQVPVTIVKTGPDSTDTSGADEWDMDTQFSAGMAGNVSNLYIYDATSLTDSDLAMSFNKFVTDNVAKAGSASFGEGEYFPYIDGAMLADDQIFAEAAAQGQSVFASAGDTGGFSPVIVPTNGVPAGAPDVNYPASSPYVVAAGGTTLVTNSTDGSYNSEIAWLAGGGGPSEWESQPYWQAGVVPTSTVGLFKDLPDISMVADPNSGANVYVNGSVMVVGGTSLSSPLSLGVWARLESSHNNTLGFAAPLLYSKYQASGFHDIILGDNGPYPAAPGWDFATGLGSFDVSAMDAQIGK